jgi:hypothetical protein
MDNLAIALLDAATAVTAFGARSEDFDRLRDEQVVELNRALAECERRLGAYKTHAAAQLARRSRRDLVHGGLAARNGFSSPEKMLQDVTKATGREAAQLVAIGRLLDEADAATKLLDDGIASIGGEPVVVPWQAPIAAAVAHGALSVECGDALRRGLGCPTELVGPELLRALAERLIAEKADLSADRLFRAARVERDLVDVEGIRARQQELYERGGIRLFPKPDGMWQLTGQLDPESAAILSTVLDPFTSPRRGGPRFVDPGEAARAQAIVDDPRTTERLALDGLLELVRLGASLDPQKMHPKLRTLVKIVTTVDAAEGLTGDPGSGTGAGFGILEANGEPVAASVIDRALCEGDSVEIVMTPNGTPLDLGRTARLYSQRQREVLAARDGGCLWPGCDRPPAFTEAHHTRHWKRDRGRTDVADGCLLCRFHHLQLHNNGWEIERRADTAGESRFWLIPPPGVDRGRTPIPLESKSALLQHLRRREGAPQVGASTA